MKRPTLADPTASDISPHATNREAFLPHSKERLSTVENHSWASRDCFFMLGDLFQFTASNWVVINEYVNWEITSIEYKPEREEAGFRDLEIYLKDLYLHRRRVTRYYELINDTKDQIKRRGPQAWPQDITSEIAAEQTRDLEDDFTNLQVWFKATSSRNEKNVRLLTALVAIGGGKQGLAENHGIARLSLLAMVFLPFSSVATILGMQGNFAPSDRKFWLFWAVGISLSLFVISVFLLYD